VLSVWGAAVIIRAIVVGLHGNGGYKSGEVAALVFAAAMIAFGMRAYRRSVRDVIPPATRDAPTLRVDKSE
jgi:hypothetical protein